MSGILLYINLTAPDQYSPPHTAGIGLNMQWLWPWGLWPGENSSEEYSFELDKYYKWKLNSLIMVEYKY